MAFSGKKKRKLSPTKKYDYDDRVVPFESYLKIIMDGHSTAHFERLCYKGCPVLPIPGRKYLSKQKATLLDMNRRGVVNKVGVVINEMDRTDRSKINIFSQLISFFRFCDSKGIENIFSKSSVELYIGSFVEKYNLGVKGNTLSQHQSVLKTFIKEYDSDLYDECLGVFYEFPNDNESVKPYTDQELKDISKCLYEIYEDYSRYIFSDLVPYMFPLYGSEYLNERGIKRKSSVVRSVQANTNIDQWKYDLSRAAYFICCFYTGVNSTALLNLRHSSISEGVFKEVSRGVYKIVTIKGRQGGKTNVIDVGFGRRARDFFKKWIYISKHIVDNNDYLFPRIVNGKASKMTDSAAGQLSRVFEGVGLPSINSQRFRKTKATLIMRTTESIFKVAEGLNNSVETVAEHYSDGDSISTEFSLAAVMDIRRRTALGAPLVDAVKDSEYQFSDPVREQTAHHKHSNLTLVSSGLRCTKPYGEKADDLKKQLINIGIATELDKVACYKFLDCFRCSFHAVIAEVQDVWMLLSFKDAIIQSFSRPAANSIPSNVLEKVSNTVGAILTRIKIEFPNVYNEAYDKYQDCPHPLWSNDDDLELIMDIYQ